MKRMAVQVEKGILAKILQQGTITHMIRGLPEDARIIRVVESDFYEMFCFIVEASSFEDVRDTDEVRFLRMKCEFTDVDSIDLGHMIEAECLRDKGM